MRGGTRPNVVAEHAEIEGTIRAVSERTRSKVRDGIRNDNLFDLLKDELTEGREHFYGRVSPELADRDHLYDRAIVDVMIRQAGKIESSIW